MGKQISSVQAYSNSKFKIGTVFTFYDINGSVIDLKIVGEGYPDSDGDIIFPAVKGPEFIDPTKFYPLYKGGGNVTFHKKSFGGANMFQTVKDEVSGFVGENKVVIYWAVILFLVDYYVFGSSFKGKLEKLFGNLIDKVTSVVGKTDDDKPAAAE
jgi:hypothetical protein